MEESGKGVLDDHDEITDHHESKGELPEVVVVPRGAQSREPKEVLREWAMSIMKDDEGESSSSKKETPSHTDTIQEVPQWLREKEQLLRKNWYDPVVVSIGPYHHEKPELQPFDKLKIYFVREYAKYCSGFEYKICMLYYEVSNMADAARKYCAEGSAERYDDISFTKMMILDGCFLLQFIYWHVRGDQDKMKMTSHEIASVERDLLLLENQIPFIVLKELMSWRSDEDDGFALIHKFIENTKYSCSPEHSFPGKVGKLTGFIGRRQQMEFDDLRVHILDLAWRKHTEPEPEPEIFVEGRISDHRHPRRSARDLVKVGIRLRPSKRRALNRITFRSSMWAHGTLNLPQIIIDETTFTVLLNFVALEHSFAPPLELRVTNYICFLNSIISQADDVKELKYAGILFNCLNDDEAAMVAIKSIADRLEQEHPYWHVDALEGIERYHTHRGKTRIATWVAEVMHDYFRSPWTAIAVIYALLAIILSFIQTYFTVFPCPDK